MMTFIMTSCGRLDLLKRTMDSFNKFNTYPIDEWMLVDDSGDADVHGELRRMYPDWTLILKNRNRGQIVCIDDAYARIKTDLIFHAEDDWAFTRPGFIEDSLKILDSDPMVVQVWGLWSNKHRLQPEIHEVDGIQYKFTGETAGWHGFSWNPGVRRLKEYKEVAPFMQYLQVGDYHVKVEQRVGQVYFDMGYKVAVLENEYLHHIGKEHHIDYWDGFTYSEENIKNPTDFKSQAGQDKWLVNFFKRKKAGFFVDIGAYDGLGWSNTYYLERELGWDGICIEPAIRLFDRLQQNRSCILVNKAVYSECKTVEFNDKDYNGTIIPDDLIITDGTQHKIEADTLTEILKQNNAPKLIEYISLDVEGAEYEVLKGFDFNEYEVIFWTIEHNLYVGNPENIELKQNVFDIMTKNGFCRIKEDVCAEGDSKYPFEDWYINNKYL